MTRQSFIRILLSLLLLMSQQMATSHVMSHWSALQGGHAQATSYQDRSALARAVAQDQSCDQCLAFAQLAGPLASHARGFAFTDPGITLLAAIAPQAARALPLRAFEPRAPPRA
ncbi:MAG TPA: hypothetical protein VF800_28165 [Telluria sp.]|jgi:hypothetical protein